MRHVHFNLFHKSKKKKRTIQTPLTKSATNISTATEQSNKEDYDTKNCNVGHEQGQRRWGREGGSKKKALWRLKGCSIISKTDDRTAGQEESYVVGHHHHIHDDEILVHSRKRPRRQKTNQQNRGPKTSDKGTKM